MTCLIRKTPVVLTPEEKVRQALLHLMVHSLLYPPSLISVEIELASIPSIPSGNLPRRRADIIVFSPQVLPLLLIECKAVPMTHAAIDQLVGYNFFVQAPYIVLANPVAIKTGTFQQGEWVFKEGLPYYRDLGNGKRNDLL